MHVLVSFFGRKQVETPEHTKPQPKFTYRELGKVHPKWCMSYLVRNWKGKFQIKPDAKQFLFWPEMCSNCIGCVSCSGINPYWTAMCKMLCRLSHWIFVINWEPGNGKAPSHSIDWKQGDCVVIQSKLVGNSGTGFQTHVRLMSHGHSLSVQIRISTLWMPTMCQALAHSTSGKHLLLMVKPVTFRNENNLEKPLPFNYTRPWSRRVHPKVIEHHWNQNSFTLASRFPWWLRW